MARGIKDAPGGIKDAAGGAKEAVGGVAKETVSGVAKEAGGIIAGVGVERLKGELRNLLGAVGGRAVSALQERVEGTAQRLTDYAGDGGGSPGLIAALTGAKKLAEGESPGRSAVSAGMTAVKETVTGALGRRGDHGGKGKKLKVTNIVESIDVGVPVRLAYDQWTQFADFPSFMKKVESVESESDEKLNWRAQVLWSHRTWESTILRQVPDEEIVWRSKGSKGSVDGAVTFHELGPRLTRILLVLEYHPQGFFEHTGNLWRAQGRRTRLELKHFRRHVMTQAMLHPDEIEGWRGVIEDGEVVKDHQTAMEEEEQQGGEEGAEDLERRGAPPEGRRDVGEEAEDEDYGAEDEYPEEQEDEYPEEQEEEEYSEDRDRGAEEEDGDRGGQQRGRHDGGRRGEEETEEERPRRVTRRTRERVSR